MTRQTIGSTCSPHLTVLVSCLLTALALLAIGLTISAASPGTSYAAESADDSLQAAKATTTTTQSTAISEPKVKIWVLAKTKGPHSLYTYDRDYRTTTFKYNSNGLLTKKQLKKTMKSKRNARGKWKTQETSTDTTTYKYDSESKMTKSIWKNKGVVYDSSYKWSYKRTKVYTHDQEGRVTHKTDTKDDYDAYYKYDSQGQLTEYSLYDGSGVQSNSFDYTYKYDRKGRLVSEKNKANSRKTRTYKYDKKGQISKVLLNGKRLITCTNKYKNGKLVKQVARYNKNWGLHKKGDTETRTYKNGRLVKYVNDYRYRTETQTLSYKKISIPKSFVPMAKAQQHSMLDAWFSIPLEAAHK